MPGYVVEAFMIRTEHVPRLLNAYCGLYGYDQAVADAIEAGETPPTKREFVKAQIRKQWRETVLVFERQQAEEVARNEAGQAEPLDVQDQ